MNSKRRGILIAALGALLTLSLFGCSEGVERDDSVNSDSGQETAVGNETADAAAPKPADEKDAKEGNEEVAEEPIEININEFIDLKSNNEAKAVKEYEGKLVQATGYVHGIKEDCCMITPRAGSTINSMRVYLSIDDLAELTDDDKITVRGTMVIDDFGGFSAIYNGQIVK